MSGEIEWNKAKRDANLAKHGADFGRAALIIEGLVFERDDRRVNHGEDRVVAIGAAGGMVLTVVYTWRGGQRRIISAWRAGRHESEAYHARLRG